MYIYIYKCLFIYHLIKFISEKRLYYSHKSSDFTVMQNYSTFLTENYNKFGLNSKVVYEHTTGSKKIIILTV